MTRVRTGELLRTRLAGLVLAGAILQLAIANLGSESFLRATLTRAVAGANPPEAEQYIMLDRAFATAAGDGNLFLRFAGFDPTQADHATFMTAVYYRAAYSLYPRRVLVSGERDVINDARDLARANFDPPDDWLVRHDVRNVLTFHPHPDGGFAWGVRSPR